MTSAAIAVATPATGGSDRSPEISLIRLLDQLRSFVVLLPPLVYRARPADRLSGSVGEHVRHCLDHVRTLASVRFVDDLSYDHRSRGTAVEADPEAAVHEIDRLISDIDCLAARPLGRPVRVFSLLDGDGTVVAARSTVARELAFVVQHTLHHYAIIALLLDRLGLEAPDGFGLAPSTPRKH